MRPFFVNCFSSLVEKRRVLGDRTSAERLGAKIRD